jgi:hypothetical protein
MLIKKNFFVTKMIKISKIENSLKKMKRIDKIRNQRAFLENNNLQKEIYSKPKMTTLLLVIFLTMHQLLRDYEARNPKNQVGFLILMMIRNKGRKKKGRFLKVYFLQEKIRRIKIFS